MGGRPGGGNGTAHYGRRYSGQPLRAVRDGDPMDQTALSRTARTTAARLTLVSALALLAGCADKAATPAASEADFVRATPTAESTSPLPSPPAGELIQPDDPQVQAAMRAWKSGRPA